MVLVATDMVGSTARSIIVELPQVSKQ